ncbi:MAG: DUF58 domain-containing protein, partial [Acidimicrobiia bacterium]
MAWPGSARIKSPRRPRRALWVGFKPFGIGETRPNAYAEIFRTIWENRGRLRYAWRILRRGVCDGCALGVAGFHDWTLSGVHLCATRLRLLRLNTMRALDLTVARRVEGLLPGDHRSSLLGRGSELAQIRPYEPVEDDVRQIDWNVTARTGVPHVRVQLAERVLVSWLVLDTSPSMAFGTADRRKADVAEGAALAIGYAATRRGNRLGVVTFGDDRPKTLPPRQGRNGLLGLLLAVHEEHEERTGATSVGEALQRVGKLARQRAHVIVVSDFR